MGYIKTCMLLAFLMGLIKPGEAQNTRKTMLEQLAALRGYIIMAEKGYRIAEEGLRLVRDIKSGEFGLHKVFFGSLKLIDQGVLQSPSLDESYRLITATDQNFEQAVTNATSSGWLRANEIGYIGALQQSVADAGRNNADVLDVLTQDGALSMTDGERIRKIDEIRTDVRARYGQVKKYITGIEWLIAQRKKEQSYIGTLKKWYDIQ